MSEEKNEVIDRLQVDTHELRIKSDSYGYRFEGIEKLIRKKPTYADVSLIAIIAAIIVMFANGIIFEFSYKDQTAKTIYELEKRVVELEKKVRVLEAK